MMELGIDTDLHAKQSFLPYLMFDSPQTSRKSRATFISSAWTELKV